LSRGDLGRIARKKGEMLPRLEAKEKTEEKLMRNTDLVPGREKIETADGNTAGKKLGKVGSGVKKDGRAEDGRDDLARAGAEGLRRTISGEDCLGRGKEEK